MAALPAGLDATTTRDAAPARSDAATPTAGQLAAAVDHHYNALRSLRVHFSETYAGMGMERTEDGTLLLRKPGRMRWSYSKPVGKVFVLDGKWGWFYTPGDAQVQKTPAKELDDLRSPLRLLLGHTQLSRELGNLEATATAAGGGTYTLSGVPRGMEQRVGSIRLEVRGDGTIQAMTLEERDGARTSFVFTGEQANVPVTDADFTFHPPDGVPVVEGTPPV
jgi:outer membrane lipoprotein carrier protein